MTMLSAIAGCRPSEPPLDSWETDRPDNTILASCNQADRASFVPVPALHRTEAIDKLKDVSVVELTQIDTLALLDLTGPAEPSRQGLRPFLVRAVAKNEGTGAFVVSLCGDDLIVNHESLGRRTPPSIRLPLVVYLDKAPRSVFVLWAIAE